MPQDSVSYRILSSPLQKNLCMNNRRLVSDWVTTGKDPAANNFKTISSLSGMMALRCIFAAPERVIQIYNTNIAKDETEMIPDDLTLHDLRHTTASILINKKLDPRAVSGVLGHANTSTRLNIYAYFFHQSSKEAASIMADALLDEPAVVNHR